MSKTFIPVGVMEIVKRFMKNLLKVMFQRKYMTYELL